MSIIDVSEEIVSEVDLNVELNHHGLRASVYVDECEVHDFVDYETMAYVMVGDREKYPDAVLRSIHKELLNMADIISEAIDLEEEEEDDDE